MKTFIEYRDDLIVGLLPQWRLRPDHGRGLIYKHSLIESSWQLSPLPISMAIALMDGRRPASEIVEILVQLLDLQSQEEGRVIFQAALDRSNVAEDSYLVEIQSDTTEVTRVNIKRFLELNNLGADSDGLAKGQLQVPIQLLFMPTNLCQTDCIYCYAERRPIPGEMQLSSERWRQLIDEAGSLGIDMVTFSGGDPLLYPDIEVLLEGLALWQIEFGLPTKTYISASRAHRLAELCSKVGTVQISIDGVKSETIDKMVGRPGFCQQAWKSIRHLVNAGVQIRTQSVIAPMNLDEVPDLIHRLYEVGVRKSNITNYSRSYFRHDDSLFLSASQIDSLREVVSQVKAELGWDGLTCNAGINEPANVSLEQKLAAWPKRAGCSGGRSSMGITPNGDVILCEQMPQEKPFVVGNVKKRTLLEVWRSPEVTEFAMPPRSLFKETACERCEEFEICHHNQGRCFRDAYFVYGNLFHPPPNCPWSPPGPRMA